MLNERHFDESLKILVKCENLTFPGKFGCFPVLRALIYNNFGCFFRRNDKVQVAHNSLLKAINILNTAKEKKYLGLTHLNISALMTQIGNSKKASFHAQKAIFEFKSIIFLCLLKINI